MSNLSDDDINEVIGDGTCTHLPQVRMALEIKRDREMKDRLEAWGVELDGGSFGERVGPAVAEQLRNRMRGG